MGYECIFACAWICNENQIKCVSLLLGTKTYHKTQSINKYIISFTLPSRGEYSVMSPAKWCNINVQIYRVYSWNSAEMAQLEHCDCDITLLISKGETVVHQLQHKVQLLRVKCKYCSMCENENKKLIWFKVLYILHLQLFKNVQQINKKVASTNITTQ